MNYPSTCPGEGLDAGPSGMHYMPCALPQCAASTVLSYVEFIQRWQRIVPTTPEDGLCGARCSPFSYALHAVCFDSICSCYLQQCQLTWGWSMFEGLMTEYFPHFLRCNLCVYSVCFLHGLPVQLPSAEPCSKFALGNPCVVHLLM